MAGLPGSRYLGYRSPAAQVFGEERYSMATAQVHRLTRPADWMRILDDMEQLLAKAAREAEDRANAVGSMSSGADSMKAKDDQFGHPDGSLRDFKECLATAQDRAAELDAELAAREAAAQRWLESASALRQRLAEWSAHDLR
jgi:TRAP-type mannitol/chloroaromatic compound transport system substrate-binding protein